MAELLDQVVSMTTTIMDRFSSIPAEDRAALRKLWAADSPRQLGMDASPTILVIDMMAALLRNEYPTGWAATGEPCAATISTLLRTGRQAEVPILYTVTNPLIHGAELGGLRRVRNKLLLFPLSQGAHHQIVSEQAPEPHNLIIKKPKPSAFFGTRLQGSLTALKIETVVVTNMTTSGCVRDTVTDAFSYNYNIIVPIDAVADRLQLSHEVSLFDMGSKYEYLAMASALRFDLRQAEPGSRRA